MKKWFKNNKTLVSVVVALGLSSLGVPAYLAKPVADSVAEAAVHYE